MTIEQMFAAVAMQFPWQQISFQRIETDLDIPDKGGWEGGRMGSRGVGRMEEWEARYED